MQKNKDEATSDAYDKLKEHLLWNFGTFTFNLEEEKDE